MQLLDGAVLVRHHTDCHHTATNSIVTYKALDALSSKKPNSTVDWKLGIYFINTVNV